jgi:beta-lactam-binding protein with PASTA domain
MMASRHRHLWRLRIWLLRALLALCALVILYFLLDWVVMPLYTRQGREFPVPDLVGLSIAEAESVAALHKLVVRLEDEKFAPDVPAGTILEQLPEAGSLCKTGRHIRVVPASPPLDVVMPNLIGLVGRDAGWRCLSLGLVCPPDSVTYVFSDTVANGRVVWQNPPPDSILTKSDTISFAVSMGPRPEVYIVPELVGQSLHEARKRIREAGLRLGSVAQKVIPIVDAGTVIAQSIRSGAEVPKGTRIDLVVAILERE